MTLVSEFIRSRLDQHEEEHLKQILDRHVLEDHENESLDNRMFSGHIYLGSPQLPIAVTDIERTFTSRPFQGFHKKLSCFLNDFLPQHNIPIPEGRSWFVIPHGDKVCANEPNVVCLSLCLLTFYSYENSNI